MKRWPLLTVLFCLFVSARLHAGPSDDGFSLKVNTPHGPDYETYTEGKDRNEDVANLLQGISSQKGDVEVLVTTDDEKNPDFQAALPVIAQMNPDRAPSFMLVNEETLPELKDGVKAVAGKFKNVGSAVSRKIGKGFMKNHRLGFFFFAAQVGISWRYWLHFSSDSARLPLIISATVDTIEKFVLAMVPQGPSKMILKARDWIADHTPLKKFTEKDGFMIGSQLTLSLVGNTFISGIFKAILHAKEFYHSGQLMHFTGTVFLTAAALTFYWNTYDAAVAQWRREWKREGKGELSEKEIDAIFLMRNLASAALMPLIMRGSTEAILISSGIGAFGTFLIWKGKNLVEFLDASPRYQAFKDWAAELHADIKKFVHRESCRVGAAQL